MMERPVGITLHIDDVNKLIESLDDQDEFKDEIKQIIVPDDPHETGALSVSDFDVDDFQVEPGELSVSDFDNDHFQIEPLKTIETVWSEHSSNSQLVGPPYSSEWCGTECTALVEQESIQQEFEPAWDPRPLKRLRTTREISKKIDHHGVAMRFDGIQERFTAYYRPSYWNIDDGAVFVGEHPTFEDAKDAVNLVALVHEGLLPNFDLSPFTAEKYTEDLKRWEGKHHMDLVCELRLRGRGYLEDGSVNYKNIGRRWSAKKIRYYSTVQSDPECPFKKWITTGNSEITKRSFDTPEEAARCADLAMVNQRGIEAWTNFPLSSYITALELLPVSFLPISTNFRENLEHKRGRIWSQIQDE